jgi:hypothetical protein
VIFGAEAMRSADSQTWKARSFLRQWRLDIPWAGIFQADILY